MSWSPTLSGNRASEPRIARPRPSHPYRGKAEIFRDVLLAAGRPASRSGIARRANVSLRVVERYLTRCVHFRWIRSHGGSYLATSEGRSAADRIDGLLQNIRALRGAEAQLRSLLSSGQLGPRPALLGRPFASSGSLAPVELR